jgi:hypothetical protein
MVSTYAVYPFQRWSLSVEFLCLFYFRYYGGWAAPNIYFLGAAGVVKFGNIRIGGLSGIYNHRDYKSGWCMNFVHELESESLVHVYEKK